MMAIPRKSPHGISCGSGVFGSGISVEEIRRFREETGIRVWGPASVKDEESIDKAVEMGVELITCNNPDEVLEILRSKGLHK